ncbi:carboxylesterase family protein [Fusibacter bizertensis]|uniref:Carboxylesterase family protein n=1 Tax=Fusibacter bizertensis TaxID=1488331 RepID=A0ABT6NBI3_9FIRM|nr:carboxylesterase family protein [Fusibacter bizertensis]MDH8677777.1 carboxylesterase family protein [Fusibacter bizertensis]
MMKKKLVSMILFFTLVIISVPSIANSFVSDDLDGRWSLGIYTKWIENGKIVSNENGMYLPQKQLTGLEFSDLALSMNGLELKLTEGDNMITRSEAALALYNVLKLDKTENLAPFKDFNKLSVDEKNAVSTLFVKGIVKGYTNGYFNPSKNLTNEEAVALLDNVASMDQSYQQGVLQNTLYGKVEGVVLNKNKSLAWIGVPYAAAPIGELRWKAPQSPMSWEGIKETKAFSEKAIQIANGSIIGSEDCLYLNIYRPNTEEANLPVLVFIHGGNNQTGTSQDFQGEMLATKTNSIIIAIDYRLGALGWLNLPALKTGNAYEDSGNFGLLDIHESLSWVKENIKSFGGNPYNVTISGQSAGGRDVMAVLISPIFRGDFQKAIALSGGMTITDPTTAKDIAVKAFSELVLEDEIVKTETDAIEWLNTDSDEVRTYLMSLSAERIASLMGNASIRMSVFPHLFADGVTLPVEGFDVFETGKYNKVPVMLGSCESEFSVFAGFDPMFAGALFSGKLAQDPVLFAQYNFAEKYGSMLYTGFNAERSAERLANVSGQPSVYAYRFKWGEDISIIPPGLGYVLGANHGSDMDFVTGKESDLAKSNYTVENKVGRESLSDVIQSYIGNFMYTGNPNSTGLVTWDKWTNKENSSKLMVLDAGLNELQVAMTTEYVIDEDVFKLMDADKTISEEEKSNLISTIMSKRFFSNTLDLHYNN